MCFDPRPEANMEHPLNLLPARRLARLEQPPGGVRELDCEHKQEGTGEDEE